MKKISILFTSFLFLLPVISSASTLYSQDITLSSGWNIISTPRILESHSFSIAETSDNFDIYVLNASSTSGWSTLDSIGQTEFTPLFGYFINNKSSSSQTLTLNYKANINPNERLFDRTFTKTGWYSIGVANPTYAKKVTDGRADTNNPSDILSSLSDGYNSVIDLTDDSFVQNANSVAVGNIWKEGVANTIDTLNDFRESKGYIVYIKQSGVLYSGFQNNNIPDIISPATTSVLSVIDFSTTTINNSNVDGGTKSYTIWAGSATVSNQSANLKSASFKFTGSAPVDSITNISLYIDDIRTGATSTINASNNNKITFNLENSPYLFSTGSHTIEVKGDIVKGANRTMSFSIENASDLFFENVDSVADSVLATVSGLAMSQSNTTYNTITVNKGLVVVNSDPGFTTTTVTGGATNVPVGQFTLKAYGEDVKVSTLRVAIATTTNASLTTLNNVSLYVNGGQVGTSQNYTVATKQSPGYLTYTLGSSLIIPAGQTVTLTVKADIVDANSAAYTSGTIAATLSGATGNAQGQSSYELVNVATGGVTGNVLTVSSGVGAFARTSGFTAVTVAPNTAGVKIGSFTLQANSAEAIKINSIGVNPVIVGDSATTVGGNTISNYSNLTLKNGSTVLGTPVGNPSTGTSTFSFNDIIVPANGTVTFDVYADIGGVATTTGNNAVMAKVTAAMAVTTRGAISNSTSVSSDPGIGITSSASSLAATTLQSSSPVAQFVVGGSTFGIATFKVSTASAGTQATVREMRFATTGTDAIESITVGGVTSSVLGSGNTATTTVSGLNIVVGSTGTDIPVTVKFSGFQGTTNGGSLTTSVTPVDIILSYVEATSGSGSVITSYTQMPSSDMTLVASKPTVTVSSGGTDSLNLGALSKIGEFTVTADANGKIAVASTSISISTVGVTNPEVATSSLVLKDGGTTISNVSLATDASATASTTPSFIFTTPYEIGAGQSKTFSIYGTINGAAQTGIVPRVNTSLTSGAKFSWRDVLGGNTLETGAGIYNFPTNSYVSKTN